MVTSCEVKPCSKCGANRWKTKTKGKVWTCRSCGLVRMEGVPYKETESLRSKLGQLGRKR